MQRLEDRVGKLEEEMSEVKVRVESLEMSMCEVKERVENLEKSMCKVKEQVENVEDNMSKITQKVHRMDLRDENEVLPRLQNIEACYTSTFIRYRDGVVQIEKMQTDVDALKTVVSEHSRKFQSLT